MLNATPPLAYHTLDETNSGGPALLPITSIFSTSARFLFFQLAGNFAAIPLIYRGSLANSLAT
jgi:hypothetical protein